VLGGAQLVAVAALDLVGGHCGHDLVAAHADVPVDPPDRHDDTASA
jgi:hypothetical protein